MKRLAEVKDSLDIEVKQNFIDPLQNLCDKDLKEIQVLSCPWVVGRVPLRSCTAPSRVCTHSTT
jgi:hypothetical protein